MITIITGVPGMGKTALVVDMMRKELEKGERPFFVMGIPDLQLDHSKVPPVKEWTEARPDPDDPSVMLQYFTFPKNSIIIIDEAQRIYRPRASTSKVPPEVAAHETHRHTGVDFWLMTQKPNLIDSNIRDLAGKHIHIKNGLLGRYLYEWPEYTDVKIRGNYADAARRKFSPPKRVFSLYKSAEVHTKQPFRIHQVWFFLIPAVAFTIYQANNVYATWTEKTNPQPVEIQADAGHLDIEQSLSLIKPQQAAAGAVDGLNALPEPVVHPYMDYKFTIAGRIQSASRSVTYYRLESASGHSVDLTDADLKQLGYSINQPNDCSAFLFFNGASVTAACGARRDSTPQRADTAGTLF